MKLKDIRLRNASDFWCLWFLLSAPGWFKIIAYFSGLLAHEFLSLQYVQSYLLDWIQLAKLVNKPEELVQYGLVSFFCILLFAVISTVLLLKKDGVLRLKTENFLLRELNSGPLKLYFFSLVISSLVLICFSNEAYIAFLCCIHFLLFILPFCFFRKADVGNSDISVLTERRQRKVFYVILGLLLFELVFMFYPLIHGRVFIWNDYMDIPEYTIMNGKYVDNTAFIRLHKIGRVNKYDPRIDKGRSPRVGSDLFFKTALTTHLSEFIYKHKNKYFYDQMSKSLQISGPMLEDGLDAFYNSESEEIQAPSPKIEDDLNTLIPIIDKKSLPNLLRMFARSNQYYSDVVEDYYNDDVKYFLDKNYIELCYQTFAGHYFHHHNYMLGPLNEYLLGKDPIKINFFYGKFSSLMLGKVINLFGGINFQNYLHASYCFYILYYLICVAMVFIVFRDLGFSVLTLVIIYASLHLIGYDSIFSAPGFNPLRHFFDLFVILFLCCFTVYNRRIYLLGCLGFAILSVLINREFGIFVLIALIMPLSFYFYSKRHEGFLLNCFMLAGSIIAALLLITLWYHSVNPMAIYSIMGLGVPSIKLNKLILMELAFVPFYLSLIKVANVDEKLKYIALYLLVYFQFVCTYLVWNPASNHFFSLGAIWGMALVVFAKMIIDYKWAKSFEKKHLFFIVLSAFVFLYIPSLFLFYLDKNTYDSIRLTHRVYAWNFERASFDTTMDPSVFENDIKLINKYVPNDKAIYIVSKYDNFLPFLAGKYSAMPYLELITSLLTHKEINSCINVILENQPEYIFVDSDINRNLNGDIFYKNDSFVKVVAPNLWLTSHDRVNMLRYLREIYYGIQKQYSPVEKGMLVTVYKRRNIPAISTTKNAKHI